MKNKPYIHTKYPDLLEGNTDADLVRLVGDLDTVMTTSPPPAYLSASIDRAVQEHVQELHAKRIRRLPQVRTERHRRFPGLSGWRSLPRRLSLAMALLLVLAVSIGAGYSVLSVLDQAFLLHPGTRPLLLRDLSKQVDLPQTVNGFTMTVKRVYADANQIVIGYNVTGPADRTFRGFSFPAGTTGPLLADEQGHQFEPMLGVGAGLEGAIGGYVLTYDGEGIGRDTKELNLRLEVPALLAIEEVSTSGRPTADKVECSDEYENICFVTVNGPLTYNFTVPVAAGRVADLHQTIEADGAAVTLQRVVVAPSGTRVYLSGIGPDARVELSIDGSKYELHSARSAAPGAIESQWEYPSEALLDKHGEWTLIIQPDRQVAEPSQPPVGKGPLLFLFAVP